jgi:hypothetical protein
MDKLRELSYKAVNEDYQVHIDDGSLYIFRVSGEVSFKEVKDMVRRHYGAGYTKLFNLSEIDLGRYNCVEVTEK